MDNPEYCITQVTDSIEGIRMITYMFFHDSRYAYAMRRTLIERKAAHTFGKYDPVAHEAAWKASLPKIEIAT